MKKFLIVIVLIIIIIVGLIVWLEKKDQTEVNMDNLSISQEFSGNQVK